DGVAVRRPHLLAPARALAGVVPACVETQAGDLQEAVTAVGVDGDPRAAAAAAPGHEVARRELAVEQARSVEGVGHGAGAVVAGVLPAAVTAAVLVRLADDPVGRRDRALDLRGRR